MQIFCDNLSLIIGLLNLNLMYIHIPDQWQRKNKFIIDIKTPDFIEICEVLPEKKHADRRTDTTFPPQTFYFII